ncbi:MAG: hypothetical protein IPK82_35495 [Polyangiaceae bacterium]|nr:hypothetical protein [Polyangiaceae bacterium]
MFGRPTFPSSSIAAAAFFSTLLGFLFIACEPLVHSVDLTFTDDGNGTRGFVCKETDSDAYLAGRAVKTGKASLVVDYIQLGGAPLCRPIKLLDWCRKEGCTLLENERACIDFQPIDPNSTASPQELARNAINLLSGEIVTNEAPEETVLVRVVVIAQTCDEVEQNGPAFDCTKLIGCANSCPVFLPDVDAVPLDLDVQGEHCESAVIVCASADLGSPQLECGNGG